MLMTLCETSTAYDYKRPSQAARKKWRSECEGPGRLYSIYLLSTTGIGKHRSGSVLGLRYVFIYVHLFSR
jgi:hypothetical protein